MMRMCVCVCACMCVHANGKKYIYKIYPKEYYKWNRDEIEMWFFLQIQVQNEE